MKDERPLPEPHPPKPSVTPLPGTLSPAESMPDPDAIHTPPEAAIGEADIRAAESGEVVKSGSLWKDAWRRLLKNKLAVFGMIVVAVIAVASLAGPSIIKR